eukprot:8921224-Ditylum_brightwellii.AAC.1
MERFLPSPFFIAAELSDLRRCCFTDFTLLVFDVFEAESLIDFLCLAYSRGTDTSLSDDSGREVPPLAVVPSVWK